MDKELIEPEEVKTALGVGEDFWAIPDWPCPVCGEDLPFTIYDILTHVVNHVAELTEQMKEVMSK